MTSITFPTLSPCPPLYQETRSLCTRVWHAVKAFFLFIAHSFYKIGCNLGLICPPKNLAFIQPDQLAELPWNKIETGSSGLFCFIHGYGGTPNKWQSYLKDAKEKFPGAHHIAPYVPHRGNCSLEEAALPLLAVVRNYVHKYPGQPLHLFGFSNGARLATYIETHLELPPESSLTIVSIAGVHEGTRMVDTMRKMHFNFGMNQKLVDELSYHSVTTRDLLKLREEKAVTKVATRHFFYASTEDEAIQPLSAALPWIKGAIYRVLHGHTHGSITDAVRTKVWHDITTSAA